MFKALLPVAVILALVVGGLYVVKSQVVAQKQAGSGGSAGPQASRAVVEIGATLPDFTLRKFGNGDVQASQLPSKVTMLNFWATWCEACMEEMPSIVRLRESFKDKGFEVAGVNVDQDPAAVLPRTIKQFGIRFPVFTDPDGKIADIFDIQAIPLTVIIDRQRKILFIENGGRDWNGSEFRSQLERWLSG